MYFGILENKMKNVFAGRASLRLVLLFSLCCWGVGGSRMRLTRPLTGRVVSFPRCPPEEALLPCVCALRGTEIHVRCENSEIRRLQTSLDVLRRRQLPMDELYVVANRIAAIPAGFFASLKVNKLFLMDNEIISISRNAFDGLETSLRDIYIREFLLEDVPYDTLNSLKELRTIIMEKTSLSHIPSVFSLSHLEFLKIDGSRVSDINPDSFRVMPSLHKIQISKSNMDSLGDNSMEGLAYLKEVIFSDNNISWVHPGAFRNLEMVEKLSLSGNAIENAGAVVMAARELKSLRIIDMSRNRIRFLSRGTFVDMLSLKEVDLSHNLLEKIDREAMYKLPSLSKLDLSNNDIYHFETNVFNDVPSLEFLNLASNNLSFIMDMKFIYRSLPNLRTMDLSANLIRGGNEISFGGHSKLETLILKQNFLNRLTKNLFRSLPSLRELRLSQNNIKRETEDRIWELPRLQILDLSQNEITNVDGNLLSGLPSLIDLYLSRNLIEDISPKAFLGLQELKSLNVSRNKIGKLHPNTFKEIENLYELDISFNELTSIDTGLLNRLSALEILHMSNNRIMNVDGKAFTDTVKLKNLDLSSNFLKQIPTTAISNLSSLKTLNFRNNVINAVRRGDFSQMRIIEIMDLSNNHIQTLDRDAFAEMNVLKDLDVSVNYIQAISSNLFENMKVMERLNASNNFISDIGNNAFENMKRLRILDLSNNSLTSIGQSIHNMPSLQGLFLNYNYISKLTNQSFINLPSLSVLFFCTNGLQTFETGTFYNLSSLMYLDLKNNSLIEINSYSFSSLKMLKELKLSQNQISSVEDYAFMNLPALQSLELQDNVIVHMGDSAFDRLSSLKFLNLSRNGLQEVPEKCLIKVPALDVLDLSWNYLTEVKDSSFHGLQWLTVLLLDHNDLCHLSPKAFSGPRSLRVLTLHNNQLKRLHLSALREPIESLSLLDMSGNPFVCDCELIWLREYLQQEEDRVVSRLQQLRNYSSGKAVHGSGRRILPAFPSPMQGQPICAGPPQYVGLPITQVPPQAFFCHGAFRGLQSKREKCIPRLIDPQVFLAEHGLSEEVLNTLLKLSNLTEMLPVDNEEPSYLDYQNPIVVSGLSELLSNYSKHSDLEKEKKSPVLKDFKLPQTTSGEANRPEKLENAGGLSSDFVTGDTPTIYAGSLSSSEQKNGEKINSGGLFGFRLPALPNILDTIGKIGLPTLGLNVNWGGLPFGRVSEGSAAPNKGSVENPFRPQEKPTRRPDSNHALWVEIVSETPPSSNRPLEHDTLGILSNKKPISDILSNERPETEIVSNRKPITPQKSSGRGNNTNHAKFYNIFSMPITHKKNQDPNFSLKTNTKPPPIPFAEPIPGNIKNEDDNPGFVHPFNSFKPGPSSGTPFLPGLVTNKRRPLPYIPNRNFHGSGHKGENIQNSEVRGIVSSSPSLKFPDEDDKEESDSWKWSPPDSNYPPLKASPHSPSAPFRPMKTYNPNSLIIAEGPNRMAKNSTNVSGFPKDSTALTPFSSHPHKHPNGNESKIQFPFRNKHQQDQGRGKGDARDRMPSEMAENGLTKTTPPMFFPTSTSPYDDWTKSFVNGFEDSFTATIPSDLETTTQSFIINNDLDDALQTTARPNPADVTERFVPVSLLSNVVGGENASRQIPEFGAQNTFHNDHSDDITTKTSAPFSVTKSSTVPFSATVESMFMSVESVSTSPPQWLYPTEQLEGNRDNIKNRDFVENSWWPPSSLGEGVTLVQGNQVHQTPHSYSVGIKEGAKKDETASHGVKHISPSRSISFGSGVPSVEKVKSSFMQGVDLPPQYDGEEEHQTLDEELELITEAPSSRRKKVGVMDWYYSNYNREYDPERPLPVGGNGPPPSSSSPATNNVDAINKLLFCTFLLGVYFT